MLNCIFNGNVITALQIRRLLNNDTYELRRDIVLELREAGRKGLLLCQECSEPVILRAGEFKVPHFAHKSGFTEKCPYEWYSKESEEHMEAKEILYNHFLSNYTDAEPYPDYRLPNKRIANLYVKFADSELVIEYERYNKAVDEFQKKFEDYKKININQLWLISYTDNLVEHYEKQKQLHFFKQMLLNESKDKVLYFLNVKERSITQIKDMVYQYERGRCINKLFAWSCPLNQVRILPTGVIESDFDEHYSEAKSKFDAKCQAKEDRFLLKSSTVTSSSIEYKVTSSADNLKEINNISDKQQQELESIYKWHKDNSDTSILMSNAKKTNIQAANLRKKRVISPLAAENSIAPIKQMLYKRIKYILNNSRNIHEDILELTRLYARKDRSNTIFIMEILWDFIKFNRLDIMNTYNEIEAMLLKDKKT